MLQQYWQIRREFDDPNTILFFRLGDFYEMFFEDAETASQLLDITLTSRNRNDPHPVPLCGVPYHAAEGYIAKLLAHGKKVAICDQVEDPRLAKGVVRRAVTRLITPGAVLAEASLPARESNYLAAIHGDDQHYGIAILDVSTGEFRATQVHSVKAAAEELQRLEVRELLVPRTWIDSHGNLPSEHRERDGGTRPALPGGGATRAPVIDGMRGRAMTPLDAAQFDPAGAPAIDGMGAVRAMAPAALPAVAAAWNYLAYLQRGEFGLRAQIDAITAYRAADYLVLDDVAKRNLELTHTMAEGNRQGSLLHLLDRTATPMGARKLKQWLLFPLLDTAQIEQRLDAVQQLMDDVALRQRVALHVTQIGDIERITARIVAGDAHARDCVALRDSLAQLPPLCSVLSATTGLLQAAQQAIDSRESVRGNLFSEHGEREGGTQQALPVGGATRAPVIDTLTDIRGCIAETLVDDPPLAVREGGLIRAGVLPELDELRQIQHEGKGFIARLEATERQRTGIASLKVRYNRVFGYYLEITHTHHEKIPTDYIRKQTLTNAERYITPELKAYEEKVVTAGERIRAIEYDALCRLRQQLSLASARLRRTAEWVAVIDVIAALAAVAQAHRYCRPQVVAEPVLQIVEGRHPVIEQRAGERFIPNDLQLGPESGRMLVITGPNMAGKSTVMRQVALITILAHMGSFVPATAATIGLTDRIFTRVGATDNLARGQSTFMVEMSEAATIVGEATARSLIIIDEIGRGTSTYDGVAIAWAIAEYLHDRVQARTLFATHFHELADLARTKSAVRNFTMAVKEWREQIVFLRKLVPGAVNRSYGIHVATLAGLPASITDRANEVLAHMEQSSEHSEREGEAPPALPVEGAT